MEVVATVSRVSVLDMATAVRNMAGVGALRIIVMRDVILALGDVVLQ